MALENATERLRRWEVFPPQPPFPALKPVSPETVTHVALDCKYETRNSHRSGIRIPFADRELLLFTILHDCSSSDETWKVKPVFVRVCAHQCTWKELVRLNTFTCLSGLANTQQQWVQFKGLYWYKTIYKNITGDVFSGIKSPPPIFFQLTQTLLPRLMWNAWTMHIHKLPKGCAFGYWFGK